MDLPPINGRPQQPHDPFASQEEYFSLGQQTHAVLTTAPPETAMIPADGRREAIIAQQRREEEEQQQAKAIGLAGSGTPANTVESARRALARMIRGIGEGPEEGPPPPPPRERSTEEGALGSDEQQIGQRRRRRKQDKGKGQSVSFRLEERAAAAVSSSSSSDSNHSSRSSSSSSFCASEKNNGRGVTGTAEKHASRRHHRKAGGGEAHEDDSAGAVYVVSTTENEGRKAQQRRRRPKRGELSAHGEEENGTGSKGVVTDGEQQTLLRDRRDARHPGAGHEDDEEDGQDDYATRDDSEEDKVSRLPTQFQNASIPYWVQKLSDLLLFHNGGKRRAQSGSGQLPADSAITQLRSDVAEAHKLLEEVKNGKDWGFLRTQPARHYEVYLGAAALAATEASTSNDSSSYPAKTVLPSEPHAPSLLSGQANSVEIVSVYADHSGFAGSGGGSSSSEAAATVAVRIVPEQQPVLQTVAEESEDLARPLLAQTIPLWRHEGAAERSVDELLEFLLDRLQVLEKRLDDPELGALYELVGAPSSSGVDGAQRASLAPALEHAYATTVTNTLLSDLFASPLAAFSGDRALRMSDAFFKQTPRIHDRYMLEEDIQPVYDYAKVRRANMFEELTKSHAITDAARHQSFSIHVDYIRFQPAQSSSIMGMFTAGTNPASVASHHHVSSITLSTSASASGVAREMDSLAQLLWASSQALDASLTEGSIGIRSNVSDAAIGLLMTSLSVITAQGKLVTFTPEEYLIAVLLHHYEQYRMLQLNLLPHLKSRSFYEAQLSHLRHRYTATSGARTEVIPEMEELAEQIEMLYAKSSAMERRHMKAMITLWSVVLRLRLLNQQQQQQGYYAAANTTAAAAVGTDGITPGTAPPDDVPFIVRDSQTADCISAAGAARQQKLQSTASPIGAEEEGVHMSASVPVATRAVGNGRNNSGDDDVDGRHVVQELSIFAEQTSSSSSSGSSSHRHTTYINTTSSTAHSGLSFPVFHLASSGQQQSSNNYKNNGNASASVLLSGARVGVAGASGGEEGGGGGDLSASGGAAAPTGGERSHRVKEFRFFLRRFGQIPETPYVLGEDELHYAAGVEGTDAMPPSSGVAAASAMLAAGRGSGGHSTTRALERLCFYQVVVFARSNSAVPPQYVGCTLPRPLTAAKVLYYNETFEIRARQEPQEILLHVVPVTNGSGRGTVVATVRLKPTLTRSYLLLPLEPPTAFMFKGKLFARYAGAGVSGVLSASTTWTSAQGLSIEQIEELFLSGSADPRDPEYAALLPPLYNYYAEMDRISAAAGGGGGAAVLNSGRRRRSRSEGAAAIGRAGTPVRLMGPAGQTPPAQSLGQQRLMSAHSRASSASLNQQRGVSTSSLHGGLGVASATGAAATGGATAGSGASATLLPRKRVNTVADLAALRRAHSAVLGTRRQSMSRKALREQLHFLHASEAADESFFASERLRMLQRRWRILSEQTKAEDQLEAKLYQHPIPLSDADSRDLVKQVRRDMAKEEAERSKQYGEMTFDEKSYYEEPSSISGLALSPLSKSTKLMLWQERQRRMKLTRKPSSNITDAELLEQYVTVPKFQLKLVFDLKPRSQLNPRRHARPKSDTIDRELLKRRRDSRIVVHIMKAHNLPERADGTPLEPFVQVGFVYEAAYSRSEVGSAPSWFQTVEVPFQPLDFDEDTLNMIDDDITITLYDKVEIPMTSTAVTGGAVSHETHYRTERRLLGTLRLPFYSLHQAASACMEGVYPLKTPRWLLGYYRTGGSGGGDGAATTTAAAAAGAAATDASKGQKREDDDDLNTEPTIQLYISLWPPLQREKQKNMDKATLTRKVIRLNVSPALAYLHHAALKWMTTATKKLKSVAKLNAVAGNREVKPFVFCSTGDMVLVCRYLLPRGGPPPASVTNVYEAIRLVCLLPFAVDIMTWGDKDVWSTNAELLTMRTGDYEELALLLAHLLRHLAPEHPTFVVVGLGEIYQQTIMVLHFFEGKEWRLIDPRTGWMSRVEKPYGTILKDVSMVISHDQIWANTQMSGLPHRMTWDLSNPAYWLPCFDTRKDRVLVDCLTAISPIQRETLPFHPANPAKAKEIEIELRVALRQALLDWRNHCPCAYHRGVEAILRELLETAEAELCAWGNTREASVTQSVVRRLHEYFGEEVLRGLDASDGAGHRHDRHHQHNSRGRRRSSSMKGSKEKAVVKAGGEESLQRHERSCIHLVGSPVTSSYNPADKKYQQILQQVFETAVHEVGTNDVSFAAGVYVKSYTENVCAMWVFLVAICRDVEHEDN